MCVSGDVCCVHLYIVMTCEEINVGKSVFLFFCSEIHI